MRKLMTVFFCMVAIVSLMAMFWAFWYMFANGVY